MIKANRVETWQKYNVALQTLKPFGVELPTVPNDCEHNGHMYYLKVRDIVQREQLIAHLKTNQIIAVFHYIPLHSSPAGMAFSVFHGEDNYTTKESERLVRLPMYYGMSMKEIEKVIKIIQEFFYE